MMSKHTARQMDWRRNFTNKGHETISSFTYCFYDISHKIMSDDNWGRGNLCPLWFHMLRTNCLGPAFPFFRIHCFRQDRCVTCAVTSQTISYLSMSHFLVPTNWVGGRGLMMLHSSGHSLNIIQSLGFHNV